MDFVQSVFLFYSEEERLVIRVWDNGLGIPAEKLSTLFESSEVKKRIGIKNVKDRIQLMYGPDYGVWIESEYLHYTEVRLEFSFGIVRGGTLCTR